MERDASEVFEYILQVEELAEEVLADKQQIIDLDRKRQQTRQATRYHMSGVLSNASAEKDC